MRPAARSSLRLACLALIGAIALTTQAWSGEPSEISRSQALAMQEAGDPLVFVDVRTPEEFASGHVPGAINIPREQLPGRFAELETARDRLVVYCERGPRAIAAAATLLGAGFHEVRHLAGDMAGWRAAGLPIER